MVNLNGSHTRTTLWLVALSLALRLPVLAAVLASEVPVVYDERDYLVRARAYVQVVGALARFELPEDRVWAAAYGQGRWPPVHPLLLAAALAIRDEVAMARLATVLISALTTALVHRLSLRLCAPRPALFAAAAHALYPTFIAYSHYLWSETTFILLLFATLLATVATVQQTSGERSRRRLGLAIATGALLGLAVLTRVSAAPLLLVVPGWLGFTLRRRRQPVRAAVAATALTAIVVLVPWQLALVRMEKRMVPLSTLGGFNLALGNNPWIAEGYGSSWGHPLQADRLHAELRARAAERSVPWETVAADLALEELRRRPLAGVGRALERLRMLWAPDHFPLRHLYRCVYPPLPAAAAAALSLLIVLAYLALGSAALYGLVAPKRHPGEGIAHRSLLVAVLVAGMLPPALTLGMSRLHQPLLAVALPAAGLALSDLLRRGQRLHRPAAVAVVAWLAIVASSLPLVARAYLEPSAYYATTVARLGRLLGFEPRTTDLLELRRTRTAGDATDSDLLLSVADPSARFRDGSRLLRWPAEARPRLFVDLVVDGGAPPPALLLKGADGEVELAPIRADAWRQWRASGLTGVEIRWLGGSRPLQ